MTLNEVAMQISKNEAVARLILAIANAVETEIAEIYAATFLGRPRLSPSEAKTSRGEIAAYLVTDAGPKDLPRVWNATFSDSRLNYNEVRELLYLEDPEGYLGQEAAKDLARAALSWARSLGWN